MRCVVFSDSHGDVRAVRQVFARTNPTDCYLFLGDGESDVELVSRQYPERTVLCVSGNCDRMPISPPENFYFAGDVKIAMVHGHRYGVKSSTGGVLAFALRNGAKIALFGHTHSRFYRYDSDTGVYLLNPGSVAQPRDGRPPSYAYIDLLPTGIFCAHVDL